MQLSYIAPLIVLIFLGGCADVQYLDRPTPPGNAVPPPILAAPPAIREIPRSQPQTNLAQVSQTSSLRTQDGLLVEPESTVQRKTVQKPENSGFKKVYSAQENPRIAIFLNRDLSQEVRQWSTKSKLTTSGDGKLAAGVADFLTAQAGGVKGEGNQSIYEQEYVNDENQTLLSRKDLWLIEQGFMQPFLEADTNIVDRATIMRLVAAADKDVKNSDVLVSPKLIEMKSLEQYADIFIELLVTEDSALPIGFFMKASAKEVKTGRILATVNSLTWDWDTLQETTEKPVATANGYEFHTTRKSVPLDHAAEILAGNLMNNLSNMWK